MFLEIKNLEYAYQKHLLCLMILTFPFLPGDYRYPGENGAGKSTLLKLICGLLTSRHGRILLKVKISRAPAEMLAGRIGYLSQDPNDYLFHDTVREEIAYGLKVRGKRILAGLKKRCSI